MKKTIYDFEEFCAQYPRLSSTLWITAFKSDIWEFIECVHGLHGTLIVTFQNKLDKTDKRTINFSQTQ